MEVKVHASIREFDEKKWDAIVGRNQLICTHRYLDAIEQSQINDCRYFYPVVYEGGKMVAHTCVYYISTELDAFAQGWLKQAINSIRQYWGNFLLMHSIECGTPVALGNTFSFREGGDQLAWLRRLVHAIEQLARDLNVRILLFRDFREEERHLFNGLLAEGYRPLKNLPCARMAIRWANFTEYLNSMRSSYRHKTMKRINICKAAGVCFEVLRDFGSLAADLDRLWKNAYDHASEYKREILPARFFERINAELGEQSSVILARQQRQPVGFALLLHEETTLEWLFCGLDYGCNRENYVYFNLMYQIIDFAIQKRFLDVNLGITTIIPKLDVGAVVLPLHMYMKHMNPVLNRIVPSLFRAMTPQGDIAHRSVFKTRATKASIDE